MRVVAPSTLLPPGIERFGVEVFTRHARGPRGADIVMMLRLQRERMNGSFVPSTRNISASTASIRRSSRYAKPDALVMHPGPMNRGVEIDSAVADGAQSLIREQVEMGVAVRMAVLEALSRAICRTVSCIAAGTDSRARSCSDQCPARRSLDAASMSAATCWSPMA